jgi:acyl carrier protein phosphodiesterase
MPSWNAGDEFDGIFVSLPGYKLVVTGGTDHAGFSMRRDIEGSRLKRILPVMEAEDWLCGYADLDRLAGTLDRIAGRLSNGNRFKGAIADVHANYTALEGDFFDFFPDLMAFCNGEDQVT